MKRRTFLKSGAIAGVGVMASGLSFGNTGESSVQTGKRIGIIGLDTSHATAFTQSLNRENASPDFDGYKVVAAYPHGSRDIESSVSRIPRFTEEIKKLGVEIVDSISTLIEKSDKIFLLTNDGRRHLEQAIPVFKAGKLMFIDKPIAASLTDAFAIFQAAKDFNQPVFSSSGLRYISNIGALSTAGDILGADTFSPCLIEPTHPDIFWYGIHGVETLFTVMGTGCKTVSRVHTPDTDFVVGVWNDNRIGSFRGVRTGRIYNYGGTAFGTKSNVNLGDFGGYDPMLKEVIKYFNTGISPVSPEETLEIFTFMEAADESKRRGGASVNMDEIAQKAMGEVRRSW